MLWHFLTPQLLKQSGGQRWWGTSRTLRWGQAPPAQPVQLPSLPPSPCLLRPVALLPCDNVKEIVPRVCPSSPRCHQSPVPLPCLSRCPCSVWLAQPDPRVSSAWHCWDRWRLGGPAPTPCHRAAAGPSRWNPVPGVTHGGFWVLRTPLSPCPPSRRGGGSGVIGVIGVISPRRARIWRWPGRRAGRYLHVPAPATPLL